MFAILPHMRLRSGHNVSETSSHLRLEAFQSAVVPQDMTCRVAYSSAQLSQMKMRLPAKASEGELAQGD